MILLLAILSACDSPRSQRSLNATASSANGLTTGTGTGTGANTTNTSAGVSFVDTSTSSSTASTVIPADASSCKFATDGATGFESSSTHLGDYTLCQSSSDKNVAYFQLKTPPKASSGDNVSICLIPTYSSGGNSIYVGNPMCGTFTDPKTVRKITFVKYSQYANATINGVIFFKDLSYYYPAPFAQTIMTLEAYKACMAYLAYPYYNSNYCTAFKTLGQYVYKSF